MQENKREVFSEEVRHVLLNKYVELFSLNTQIWEAKHAPVKLIPEIPGITVKDFARIDFYRRMFAKEVLFAA